MADLNKVRVQVLDPATGNVIENVDVKTSDGAVYLPDGTSLRDWISNSEAIHTEFQKDLAEHLAMKHVDVDKIDSIVTGIGYNKDTGTFTITTHDGETEDIDTLLEKLAINFDLVDGKDVEGYEEGTKLLEVTLDDGTKKYANLSDLIDIYDVAENATEVQLALDSEKGEFSASLVDGGISTAKIADDAVTTTKIINSAVTNDKIADTTIARAKINAAFEADIAAVETALGKNEDGTYTSVDGKITTAIEALDATVTNVVEADEENNIEAVNPDVAVTITQEDGVVTGVTATVKAETFDAYGAAAAVQGDTEETVASVDAKVSALTTSSEVTVEKLETPTSGYISSYIVKQNGEQVGATIDIPKDYLVKSANLKKAESDIKNGEGEDATVIVPSGHQYIDFVINTVGDDGNESHIFLDVNTLVDVYGVVEDATEVQLALDAQTNKFSASLVDGGISTAKIADDAVTNDKLADDAVDTDNIVDGAVTTDKLADSAVTNDKIADTTIARAKIDADFEADIAALEAGTSGKVTLDDEETNLKFVTDANSAVISVVGPDKSTVYTKVGTAVEAISVTASATGAKASDATLEYQWYKKVVGTDVAFVAIEGATTNTLAADKIAVAAAGSTMYYCVVTATGEGVVADPVASKKVTVIVAA